MPARAIATVGPPELGSFPARPLPTGAVLHRITLRLDPDGSVRKPWYFSASGTPGSGRFDLLPPRGTCYFSDAKPGAFVEVFRRVGVIDRADLARRRLFTATRTGPALRLADLRARRAARFGVTADLSAGDDYTISQPAAQALFRAGFAGVAGTIRHDPSLRLRNVAVFGRAGAFASQRGWQGRRVGLELDRELAAEVVAYGYAVVDIPYDVTTTDPS